MSSSSRKKYTVRSNCRICLTGGLLPIVTFPDMPLAGGFLQQSEIRDELTFPLSLTFCPTCHEVQIQESVSSEILFKDYRFLASTTESLQEHFVSYAKQIKDRFNLTSAGTVVEFGSNDGVLLKPFMDLGIRAIGIEPAANIAQVARSKGCTVINDFLNENTASQVTDSFGKADIVCANNVFAHIDDMHEVMRSVNLLLKPNGAFVFEVHYLLDLLERWQYDMIYHEHMMYHSLSPLLYLMKLFDLEIVDVERQEVHCGSIRVTARRKQARDVIEATPRVEAILMLEQEKGLDCIETYAAFGAGMLARSEALTDLVRTLRSEGKRVVGYGASGRASVLMNLSKLGTDRVEYVVDVSPERQGRYIPGQHNPIVSPEHFRNDTPDIVIVFAYNYLNEITAKEHAFLRRGGRFLIPAPDPRVL